MVSVKTGLPVNAIGSTVLAAVAVGQVGGIAAVEHVQGKFMRIVQFSGRINQRLVADGSDVEIFVVICRVGHIGEVFNSDFADFG